LGGYLVFLWTGIGMIAMGVIVAVMFTTYADERGGVWADPWAYRWDIGCVPSVAPAHVTGVRFCQESMAANLESERSQESKALGRDRRRRPVGRGLGDTMSRWCRSARPTTSSPSSGQARRRRGAAGRPAGDHSGRDAAPGRRVPARAADHAGSPRDGARRPDRRAVLFVYAATVNLVPDSGIPAPFLSRGGQSNLALILAVALVVALAPRAETVPAWSVAARPATGRRRWQLGRVPFAALLIVASCAAVAINVTFLPYEAPWPLARVFDSQRAPCPAREDTRASLNVEAPDPARCSTDRIAYDRTRVESVSTAGRSCASRVRTAGAARRLARRPGHRGPQRPVRRPGTGQGLLDQSFGDIVYGTAGSRLRDRLTMPVAASHLTAQGIVDLTNRPGVQHAIATAMRTDSPAGGTPLAGGMVVLDASSGRVLAGVSGPIAIAPRYPAPADDAPAAAFLAGHADYGLGGPHDALDGSYADAQCGAESRAIRRCWKWNYHPLIPPVAPNQAVDLRRYVDGDPSVALPRTDIDRRSGSTTGSARRSRGDRGGLPQERRPPGQPARRAHHGNPGRQRGDPQLRRGGCPDVADGQITTLSARVTVVGASSRLSGRPPLLRKAAAITTLNVEPNRSTCPNARSMSVRGNATDGSPST